MPYTRIMLAALASLLLASAAPLRAEVTLEGLPLQKRADGSYQYIFRYNNVLSGSMRGFLCQRIDCPYFSLNSLLIQLESFFLAS